MITLVSPENRLECTGGYLYNKRVAAELPKNRFNYCRLPSPPPDPRHLEKFGIAEDSLLLLDSLYFSYPEWVMQLCTYRSRPLFFLVHYLPSLNPLLKKDHIPPLRRNEKACLSRAARIIATSAFTAESIKQLYGAAPVMAVVSPGLDKHTGTDRHQTSILLTVAHWTPAKNHIFLLSVLSPLSDLSWELRIFGEEDPARTEVFSRQADRLGISERIHIGGVIPNENIICEMKKADIFLFPSLFESYGMVVAEALSAGLPVIANRTGGIPEVVGESPAAYLCNTGDTLEWSAALRDMLRYPENREKLTLEALKRANMLPAWHETAFSLLEFLEKA